jgi:hypothetical protein
MHAAVPVCIRNDLIAAGEAAIERYLLESNLLRRQLTPLEAARAYERLKQLERNERKNGQKSSADEDYRTLLAKRFGFRSHRQLDRLCSLLALPIPVQKALEQKQITQAAALRLLEQSPEMQQAAAKMASSGQLSTKSLNAILGPKPKLPIADEDYKRMWWMVADLSNDLRHCFPRSFDSILPKKRADAELLLKRLRSLLVIADEVRRRFFPDYEVTDLPMKPILKWPAAMLLERIHIKLAMEADWPKIKLKPKDDAVQGIGA